MKKEIFKAYDIRGIYPSDINAEDVKNIVKAYAVWLKPKKVALGRDVRISGPELWEAAAEGLTEMGVDVVDIGEISTDMLYFAVAEYDLDGGITISASHNSGEYNGMKLVREGSRPISIDTGIAEIRDLAMSGDFQESDEKGQIERKDILDDYVEKMTSFVPKSAIKPFKVVVNPNFGASGEAIQRIADHYGVELVKVNFEPNGNFPKGKPDPTQSANRTETAQLVTKSLADFGVTWDADADRCFFFDEKGEFVLPYYITGCLIDYFLSGKEGESVVIDPRLRWLPAMLVSQHKGNLVINKSGHSFIKERMRQENSIFGAEASAHYYFKDLWFTDNGMLPFVIMLKIMSLDELKFSELVSRYMTATFALEEINFFVDSVSATIERVKQAYPCDKTDEIDGYSAEFEGWRMNLRGSNTEPVIRLNIEAKSKDVAYAELKKLEGVIGGKKA